MCFGSMFLSLGHYYLRNTFHDLSSSLQLHMDWDTKESVWCQRDLNVKPGSITYQIWILFPSLLKWNCKTYLSSSILCIQQNNRYISMRSIILLALGVIFTKSLNLSHFFILILLVIWQMIVTSAKKEFVIMEKFCRTWFPVQVDWDSGSGIICSFIWLWWKRWMSHIIQMAQDNGKWKCSGS